MCPARAGSASLCQSCEAKSSYYIENTTNCNTILCATKGKNTANFNCKVPQLYNPFIQALCRKAVFFRISGICYCPIWQVRKTEVHEVKQGGGRTGLQAWWCLVLNTLSTASPQVQKAQEIA